MKNYEKPMLVRTEQMSEGVYLASGAEINPGAGSESGSTAESRCKSKYMKGNYVQPTNNPIEDGYKKGRGCEGCPAWNGSSCRLQSAPDEMNWDGDFRPAWEVQGHFPDEKGY